MEWLKGYLVVCLVCDICIMIHFLSHGGLKEFMQAWKGLIISSKEVSLLRVCITVCMLLLLNALSLVTSPLLLILGVVYNIVKDRRR